MQICTITKHFHRQSATTNKKHTHKNNRQKLPFCEKVWNSGIVRCGWHWAVIRPRGKNKCLTWLWWLVGVKPQNSIAIALLAIVQIFSIPNKTTIPLWKGFIGENPLAIYFSQWARNALNSRASRQSGRCLDFSARAMLGFFSWIQNPLPQSFVFPLFFFNLFFVVVILLLQSLNPTIFFSPALFPVPSFR